MLAGTFNSFRLSSCTFQVTEVFGMALGEGKQPPMHSCASALACLKAKCKQRDSPVRWAPLSLQSHHLCLLPISCSSPENSSTSGYYHLQLPSTMKRRAKHTNSTGWIATFDSCFYTFIKHISRRGVMGWSELRWTYSLSKEMSKARRPSKATSQSTALSSLLAFHNLFFLYPPIFSYHAKDTSLIYPFHRLFFQPQTC